MKSFFGSESEQIIPDVNHLPVGVTSNCCKIRADADGIVFYPP